MITTWRVMPFLSSYRDLYVITSYSHHSMTQCLSYDAMLFGGSGGIRISRRTSTSKAFVKASPSSFSEFVSPFLGTLKHVKDWSSPVVRNSPRGRESKQKKLIGARE